MLELVISYYVALINHEQKETQNHIGTESKYF